MEKRAFVILIIWSMLCPIMSFALDTINISKKANSFEIKMIQGRNYGVSCSSWLSVKQTNIGGLYNITTPANHVTQNRQGWVTFRYNGTTEKKFIINQEGSFNDCTIEELTSDCTAGWNLGNTMECLGTWINSSSPTNYETAWGNPVTTKAIFQMVKDNGFNTIRIPCSWYSHTISGTKYVIDPKWMARVKEIIDMALSEDLMVILNCHYDGGWLEKNCNEGAIDSVKNIQFILWTQIAEAMKDYDEYLLFASANEPDVTKAEQINALKTYHQAFIDAVRGEGGNNAKRCLVIQAPSTSTELAIQYNNQYFPTDNIKNKLMLEVHYYTPFNFCLMEKDESWGNIHYFWGKAYHTTPVYGVSRNCTYGEESYVDQQMALMKTYFTSKGIPVMIGEYSAAYRTLNDTALQNRHDESREYWYKYITMQAKRNGVIPFVWDTGQILDRKTLSTPKDSFAVNGIKQGVAQSLSTDIYTYTVNDYSDSASIKIYNTNGIRLNSLQKGINIMKFTKKNGNYSSKKILIK